MNKGRKMIWDILTFLDSGIDWKRYNKGDTYLTKYDSEFIKNYIKSWWHTVDVFKTTSGYILFLNDKFDDYKLTIIIETIQLNKFKSKIIVIEGHINIL